jgi:poly-gamma-glutamate capsule biosynthesis protein CapA/YwtB (metallophosphatase superfamily)
VLVYSFATPSSGTPRKWAATSGAPGINLLPNLSAETIERTARHIIKERQPGDVIVVSIHWGPNWGYEVSDGQRRFAHDLIDAAGVSVIHGHSSHHAKALEVYRDRLILYGCGDFLNDYEGIRGYEMYRDDLALMYLIDVTTTDGTVNEVEIVALSIKRMQLVRASTADVEWIRDTLDTESHKFATTVTMAAPDRLTVDPTVVHRDSLHGSGDRS